MTNARAFAAVSPLLAWLVAVPAAQQPARAPAVGTSDAASTAVLVDVVVRDRHGRPVTDLAASDFELREEDEAQRIGSFTRVARGGGIGIQVGLKDSSGPAVIPPPGSASSGESEAAPAPMTTALVFDALSAPALGLCQRATLAYIPRNATSASRVGVFITEPSARVLQAYTDHPALVRQAVSRVMPTGTSVREQSGDAIGELRARRDRLEVQSAAAASATTAQLATAAGNIGQLEMERRLVQGQLRMLNAFETLDRDHRGVGTASALFAVLQTLIELPGRKTIVFFSEGLPATPALQAHLQSIVEAANRVNVTVYTIDASGLRALSSTTDARRELEELGKARLGQLAQTRDDAEEPMTRALERAEDMLRLDSQSGLARLAEGTGGFLVGNTNDLSQAFQRIDEDMRFHYLITYEPTNQVMDGTFRRIDVKVRRPGVTVFARKGYRALRVPSSVPVVEYETAALAALDAPRLPSDLPFGTAALAFPEADRAGLVLPIVRLATRALEYERDAATDTYRAQATIVVRFRDTAGRVVEKVSQQYQLSGRTSELEAARNGEILFYKEPVLAPGVYAMEAAVHDGVAGRASAKVVTVDVPRAPESRARLSSIVIVRRSEQIKAQHPLPNHPLQVGDVLVYPSTGEPLSRSRDRELAFYYVLYLPVTAAADTTSDRQRAAVLQLRRSGRVVSEVPLSLGEPDEEGRIRQVGRFPLASLSDGLYELAVLVRDAQETVQRSTYFTVVG